MVITAGALSNIRKQKEYSKSVKKCKQIIADRNEELNDETISLESKTRNWSNMSGIGGILFMTSLAGVPLFERVVRYGLEALEYEHLMGDPNTIGMPGLAYFFGSMIAWGIGTCGSDIYANQYLEELKKQAKL